MAQQRVFDAFAKDLTSLLNKQDAGMLSAGVYLGFNLSKGAGAREIDIDMDVNPNKPSELLGVIHTFTGVTVLEDAALTPLNVVAASPHDRVDVVVAVYSYNLGKPSNVCSYTIRQGTPGTTGFVNLTDGSTDSIKVETFTTSAKFNGWRIRTSAGTAGSTVKITVNDGTSDVEVWDNVTRANAVATINGNSKFIWVTVLTAGSPGLPANGQNLTISGGVDPVAATLGPNDHLLGRVYVRKNQSAILTEDVASVIKLRSSSPVLNDTNQDSNVFRHSRPLVGAKVSVGSTPLLTSISAGSLLDKSGRRVPLSAQSDVFSATSPATGTAKKTLFFVILDESGVVEGVENPLTPRYFSVSGAAVPHAPMAATDYPNPTSGAIIAAAASTSPRYSDASQIYYLGYRVTATDPDGAVKLFPPVSSERFNEIRSFEVHDGITSQDISGPYSGWNGFAQLLTDLASVESGEYVETYTNLELPFEEQFRAVEVKLRGFFIADNKVQVPAGVYVSGPATVLSLVVRPLEVAGIQLVYNNTDDTWAAIIDPDQDNVPGGSTRIQVDITPLYLGGVDLVARGFVRPWGAGGAYVSFNTSPLGNAVTPARPAVVVNGTRFKVVMTAAELSLFNPTADPTASLVLRKANCGLRDLFVLPGISGEAEILLEHTHWLQVERLLCDRLLARNLSKSRISGAVIDTFDSTYMMVGGLPKHNTYNDIIVYAKRSAAVAKFANNEAGSSYRNIAVLGTGKVALFEGTDCKFDNILQNDASTIRTEVLASASGNLANTPIAPFSVAIYAPGATPLHLTDDGAGILRDAAAGNGGTARGTIDYATGAYAITYGVSPTGSPTWYYATTSVLQIRSTNCLFDTLGGVAAVDSNASLNVFRAARDLIFRHLSTDNSSYELRGTLGYPGPEAANKNVAAARYRSGSNTFNGTNGRQITFSKKMPSTAYRVSIVPTGDISNGLLGDVYALDTEKTVSGFIVRCTGWDVAGPEQPSPLPAFDWVAYLAEGASV